MAISHFTGDKADHSRFPKNCRQEVVICNERVTYNFWGVPEGRGDDITPEQAVVESVELLVEIDKMRAFLQPFQV